ncbi:MAG: 50S ribosomal protein L17 [Minisyncoccota bacterium]
MRHHNRNKKFGRERNVRNALMRSLARALIIEGCIETTEVKAKALRPFIERLVTTSRGASVGTRRLIIARLGGRSDEAKKLIEEIAPKYRDRSGGYTRVLKRGARTSDGARMALIEFV